MKELTEYQWKVSDAIDYRLASMCFKADSNFREDYNKFNKLDNEYQTRIKNLMAVTKDAEKYYTQIMFKAYLGVKNK